MPIDPKIFELIRSSDVEERKKGVKALARSEDREALRYLASLYKDDPDAEVRDLALKAGQHIKKRGELSEWGSDQGKHAGKFEDVEIKRDAPKQRGSLPDNAKTREAKALMDKAMDLMMMSNYAEAQDLAYQAFELVPNLDSDSYYATLASDIMGMEQAQAIATLREGRPDYEFGNNGKKKAKRGDVKQAGWTDFLVDSAIIYVVAAASMAVLMVVLFNQVQSLIESGVFTEISRSAEFRSAGVDPIAEFTNFISTSGVTVAIITGLSMGLGFLLFSLVQFTILHFCAGMLGGDGSFFNLIHQSVIPLAVQSIASAAIAGVSYYFTFQLLIEAGGDPNALAYSANRDTVQILNSLNGLSLLVGVGYVLWISFIIGKVYDFGFGKGCGTLIIGWIVSGIALCGCFFAFTTLLSAGA